MSELHLIAQCAACGHDIGKHPSAEHARAYLAASGRYVPECNGVPRACGCRVTREEVSAHWNATHLPHEPAGRGCGS